MTSCPGLPSPRWFTQWSLFCLISMIVSQTHIPGLIRSKHLKVDIRSKWKNALRIERVKDTILKNLNISKPPFITARTLQVQKKVNAKRDPREDLYFAEATDPYKKDAMMFKIHSKFHDQMSNIETPILFLRLRVNKKRSSSSRERKSSEKSRGTETPCRKKEKSSKGSTTKPQGDSSDKNSGNSNCDEKSTRPSRKATTRQLRRKQSRHQRLKPRKVKLIVRVLDPVNKKRRRIFAKKILLKKSKIFSVPVPKKIFLDAAKSSSHSLTVQVRCRNCKRYVKMDKVYRGRRKNSSKNPLRLNVNRPYILIKYPSVLNHSSETNSVVTVNSNIIESIRNAV